VEIPAAALRRFWRMVAHYHGQIWNGAELARALAVSPTSATEASDETGMLILLGFWQVPGQRSPLHRPKFNCV
jgi:predicted AAA+ superfamily ATPase